MTNKRLVKANKEIRKLKARIKSMLSSPPWSALIAMRQRLRALEAKAEIEAPK